MALLTFRNVDFSYGGRPLVEQANFRIERGERICLVGRNGAGKSTLLRLIAGELAPDAGEIERDAGVVVSRLAQEVPTGDRGTVWEEAARGFGPVGERLARQHALQRMGSAGAGELQELAGAADAEHDWQRQQQVDRALEQVGLDPHLEFARLSSGMKRRALLAQALVSQPDVLLLDEPTNHLDLESIRWIETFLQQRFDGTLVFITHDRAFLQKLARRIIEIDRGRLLDWECDYPTFLQRREQALQAEARQQELFDKKLAQEEVWIRKGIEARRTRNEGRVRALHKLRAERQARREKTGQVRFQVQDADRSGMLVAEAKNIGFAYGGQPVIRDFSTLMLRGDRVGIVGPNGAGKTTLLRILLGQLTPQTGTVRLGTNLQIAYFDQLRAQLNEDQTAIECVGEGNDRVQINGESRHVMGWLQDFLFSPDRARTLVRYLSGGERNRLLFAKLLSQPSNLLVLDEPTNDLDLETLELLEEVLLEYPGTLLLVSHDRVFLNNVVTSVFAFEGEGVIKEYAGGYDDWQRQRTEDEAAAQAPAAEAARDRRPTRERAKKLSFKETRELEELPLRIETLETEQAALHEKMADPAFYQQPGTEIAEAKSRLDALQAELAHAYSRWELLEGMGE
jgi:ATP-binding cassette subfamily F protein uup